MPFHVNICGSSFTVFNFEGSPQAQRSLEDHVRKHVLDQFEESWAPLVGLNQEDRRDLLRAGNRPLPRRLLDAYRQVIQGAIEWAAGLPRYTAHTDRQPPYRPQAWFVDNRGILVICTRNPTNGILQVRTAYRPRPGYIADASRLLLRTKDYVRQKVQLAIVRPPYFNPNTWA